MINRNRVNFDTAGQRVIINPGELTNTGGDNWDITPSGYVPLTSVTPNDIPNTIPERDVNCGFSVGNLQIDLTPPVAQTADVGKMVWNDTDGTIEFELKGGNVSIPIGEKEVIRCRNADVAPMVAGQVVYISGSTGNHKEIKLANATTEATSAGTIGIVAEPIAVAQEGYVTTAGLVKDINTLALTQGAPIWLSTVSGQMTTTRPNAPNHGVLLGFCVRQHATVGVVYVKVDNGWELDELHNVYITAPATGDLLVYDAVNKYWKNLPTASQPWVLKAGDTMTGNLTISSDKSLIMTQGAIYNVSRAMPTAVGNTVEIATITNSDFSANCELWYTVHSSGFAQSKRFFFPLSYNATNNVWQKVLPVASTGPYSGEDADLDIKVSNAIATLRIRRSSFAVYPNATIDLALFVGGSNTTFTPSTITATGVAAPTVIYAVKAEGQLTDFLGAGLSTVPITNRSLIMASTMVTDAGVYSLNSWNGTGYKIPLYASVITNNGGASPAVSRPALVLARQGVNGVAFGNFAEFKIRRWEASGTNARTAIDIALTHGSNEAAGANVMTIQSNGNVGVGTLTPTAAVHLKAGTTAASTAPLKFSSGSLMTASEAGAVEFLTDKAYLTITTGTARKEIALNDATLTAGQQPTTTTNGRLTNSNKYSIYATGTTNGTAGSAVNLTLFTLPNNGDLRFLRITVKAKSAAAMPDIFGRTLDAMWGNGAGVLTQVGADQLGTALTFGNLAAATIATTAAGTTLRVTCTDVTGCAAVVTWEVFGEYY